MYSGEMARTTKRSREIASDLEGVASASQVERWTVDEYGPDEPLSRSELVEHFAALAPLMGSGRDGDVAVIRMAAEHLRRCKRLRTVLLGVIPQSELAGRTADELLAEGRAVAASVSHGRWTSPLDMARFLQRGANIAVNASAQTQEVDDELGRGESAERAKNLRSGVLGTAELSIAQALTGEPTEPEDAADLLQISGAGIEDAVGAPITGALFDPAEGSRLFALAAAVAKGSRYWAETSAVEDLAQGVAVAAQMVAIFDLVGVDVPAVGTEDRWLVIGKMAPAAFQLGATLVHAVRDAGASASVSDAFAITAYLVDAAPQIIAGTFSSDEMGKQFPWLGALDSSRD